MAFQYRARSNEDWEKRSAQQGGSFEGFIKDEFKTYTVKKGDNFIRILPPTWDNAEHYGTDAWVHFSVGPDNASVLCLHKMKGEACPICEARARAERDGDKELADELKPARRVVVWIIDRKDEGAGPLIWGMPWTLDRDIAKVCRDKQTGAFYLIDHPDEGYDVSFEREGDGQRTKYTGVQLARRPSSVDTDVLDYIQEYPATDCFVWRSYDEVAKLFRGGLADGDAKDRGRATSSNAPTQEPSRERERARAPEPERPAFQRRGSSTRDEAARDSEHVPADPPFDPAPRERESEPPARHSAPPKDVSSSGASRAEQLRQKWNR